MLTTAQSNRLKRDREIVAKARSGTPYVDLAARYRITFQRVWQLCKAAGLQLPPGKQRRSQGVVSPTAIPVCPPGKKVCTQCGIPKSFAEFSKGSRESDGLQDNCKACNKAISAAYRADNPEKERERHAIYHAANKDQVSAKTKRWRKANPEKVRANARRFYANNRDKELTRHAAYTAANAETIRIQKSQWRANNIEQRRAYGREYIRNNRAKINAKTVRRKTRLMQALVAWANHEKIADFYEEAQRLTKETGIEYAVDHIVPLVHKLVCGLHCEDNLQVITGVENSRKFNKFIV